MIDYGEFAARAAAPGAGRCVILARHGRRPALSDDDPTFGENLPITEDGRAMALACGRSLRAGPPPGEWAFLASRLLRTRLTAAAVAEGLGAAGARVAVSEEASIPGLWVEDQALAHSHYLSEGPVRFNDRLVSGGLAEGYRPIPESTRLCMEWISGADFGARCAFIATHDVFLACLLTGLGVGRFSCARWVGFLQGCALFERPGGGWDAEYLVPDKAAWRHSFVQ